MRYNVNAMSIAKSSRFSLVRKITVASFSAKIIEIYVYTLGLDQNLLRNCIA